MTIIIVTFYYPVNPHYQNPGWGSGWAWVWVGLPVVYIFNMATGSIYSPSPPLTDLDGVAAFVGEFLPEDKEQKETGGIRKNTSPF
jgi:hypothetical protein